MKFIPILFSTPMVQAILELIKTITRRLKGLEKINENPDDWEYVRFYDGYAKFTEKHNAINEVYVKCPYGQSGDVLWVRESWRFVGGGYIKKPDVSVLSTDDFIYKADEDWNGPFKPSIHMPKTACRLFLQVESIRVERLNDISEQDAAAEGIIKKVEHFTYQGLFIDLWVSINGKGSWQSNPWVWVVTFKKIDKPEGF